MKRFSFGVALILFFNIAFSQSRDIETIKKLNTDWLNSYITRDTATLAHILAEDFTLITPNGSRTTKHDALNNLLLPNVQTISVHQDNVEVRIVNGVGIIFCNTTFVQKINNKEVTGRNCYMDVYAKRNGKWYAVAGHVTLLSK